MPINKIGSNSIADGAVTADDLAPGAAVPTQSGNAGKYLTTDGTNASWVDIGTTLTVGGRVSPVSVSVTNATLTVVARSGNISVGVS